jgi:hypothetical protein
MMKREKVSPLFLCVPFITLPSAFRTQKKLSFAPLDSRFERKLNGKSTQTQRKLHAVRLFHSPEELWAFFTSILVSVRG